MTALKALVLSLVLANIGYFLWARYIDVPAPPAVSVDSALPALKLTSEVADASGTPVMAAEKSRRGSADSETIDAAASGAAGGENQIEDASAVLLSHTARCVSIGPFRDVAETSRAAITMRTGGFAPRQRVAEGEVFVGIWVYVPKPETRAASDRVLADLRQAGIDDALEMPGPNEGPVISLGLFSEPKRAQTRVAQAQSVGLKPQLSDRHRTGNVFWIDIDMKATDPPLNLSDLRGEAGRILRVEVRKCPSQAPAPPPSSPAGTP